MSEIPMTPPTTNWETTEPAPSSPTYSALPVVCATYDELPEFLTYSGLARLAATTPTTEES